MKTCPICNKEVKSRSAIYCSKECQHKSMQTIQFYEKPCLNCGKILTYKQLRMGQRFCCYPCAKEYRHKKFAESITLYNCNICNKPLTLDQCNRGIKTCSAKCAYQYRRIKYGYNVSPEALERIKQKCSERSKELWKNEEFRNKVKIRMTENNPSHNPEVIKKALQTKEKNNNLHVWKGQRGGNGKISNAENCLLSFCTSLGFLYNKAIATSTIRKQFPNEHYGNNYKPDFTNFDIKLCIEIDGDTHNSPKVRELDKKKEFCLSLLGYKTIRFTNQQVFEDIENVKHIIIQEIERIKNNGNTD